MTDSLAARFYQYGPATEVVSLEKQAVPPPGPGQIQIKMHMAPINPADLGTIAGKYGIERPLPATGGNEGVGVIEEIGPDARGFLPGESVLPPPETPTWCQVCNVEAEDCLRIPTTIPVDQAAMAAVNPLTASLLLKHFIKLNKGDWIIQNAANSSVGTLIIQLARTMGIKTFNIVRSEAAVEHLTRLGVDEIWLSGDQKVVEEAKKKRISLGLNAVGGTSVLTLAKCLNPGGTLVTYGGASSDPVRFPTRELIFNDIRLRGFWRNLWFRNRSRSAIQREYAALFPLLENGTLRAPVEAIYPLNDIGQALNHQQKKGRQGKILLQMNG